MIEILTIAIALLEVILRLIPTSDNWSLIDFLHNLIMRVIPNNNIGKKDVWTSIRRSTKVSKVML